MIQKRTLLALLTIVAILSCTPKKSAEQIALEIRLAELQLELAALTANDADTTEIAEPERRRRRERAAELQLEIEGTQARLGTSAQKAETPAVAAPAQEKSATAAQMTQAPVVSSSGTTPEGLGYIIIDEETVTITQASEILRSPKSAPPMFEIPNTIEGLPVTAIGEGAFKDCQMQNVSIPFTVTTIGNSAFDGCVEMTNIQLLATVTYIGEKAFYNSGLLSVQFAGNDTKIGERAFDGYDPKEGEIYTNLAEEYKLNGPKVYTRSSIQDAEWTNYIYTQ